MEDVDKFTETLRSLSYEDLWKSIDFHWDRLFDPHEPVSSWEDELQGMTYIEIRRREKEMKLFELINKKVKRFLTKPPEHRLK
tara:strand:- start:603 stop:851 length:249 start_codon:yes stop_codon:yes gene_type:complete